MKTRTDNNGPLAGLVHSSQEVIHNLADQVRTTATKPRRLLDSRHRNDLLRELGQLHYDAHRTGQGPDQPSLDRLIENLDADRHDDEEHDEADNGHQ